jgi:phospholipase D1/2
LGVESGTDDLRVATWNIHDAKGADGVRNITRIGVVIRQLRRLGVPLIGLQEVACGPYDSNELAELALGNGYHWYAIPTRGHRSTKQYGNALLLTTAADAVHIHDLSIVDREPRGALEVHLCWQGHRLRVVNTHLGLRAGERRLQVERLLALLARESAVTTILLGDINEWLLWGRPLRWLHRRFGNSPSVRSFPTFLPVLALDRIWIDRPWAMRTIAVFRTREASRASDHLPVVATLRFPTTTTSRAVRQLG